MYQYKINKKTWKAAENCFFGDYVIQIPGKICLEQIPDVVRDWIRTELPNFLDSCNSCMSSDLEFGEEISTKYKEAAEMILLVLGAISNPDLVQVKELKKEIRMKSVFEIQERIKKLEQLKEQFLEKIRLAHSTNKLEYYLKQEVIINSKLNILKWVLEDEN